MTRRAAAAPTTVVVSCHAGNPDRTKHGRCGSELGDVHGHVRFVAVSTKQPPHMHGRIRLQCKRRDCRSWNVFEVTE